MDRDEVTALQPPLKWVGGKRWQIPLIAPLFGPHRHRQFVELFAGGAAMAFGLRPDRVILNDINEPLMNFYYWLRRGLYIDMPMENRRETYDAYRDRFNALIMAETLEDFTVCDEMAALFYYLNRTGFNGLCRYNRSGCYNVAFGRYKTINYMRDFAAYVDAMCGWQLMCSGYDDALESGLIGHDAFIYADPPYDGDFSAYSKGGFSWYDQVRLAEMLSQHPGPVVATNRGTDRVVDLYRKLGFGITTVMAPRRVSRDGNRDPVLEMIADRNLLSS